MTKATGRIHVYLWCADGMPWKHLRTATVPAWMADRCATSRLPSRDEVIWMVKEEYEYATRRDGIDSQPVS